MFEKMTSSPNEEGRPDPDAAGGPVPAGLGGAPPGALPGGLGGATPGDPVPPGLGGAPPGGLPGAVPLRPGPRRVDDRRVVVGSVVVAAGFLLVAAAAALARATGAETLPPWLPLHLALAGGASTAISGVMPFFVAALAAGHPAPVRLRVTAVALVAIGAALVSVRGIVPSAALVPAIGGCVYLAGIGAVALAVRASGRAGLMIRRPIVTAGYMLALVNVAIGASLGTLAAAGWPPVLTRWAELRPAHAWTNVLGFVSLVIVSTLLHFLPTVLGTRIVPRGSAVVAVLGTAAAVPLVVTGQMTGLEAVAGGGAVLALVGAGALVLEASRVYRARGTWTTDPGWHRMASIGLLAGVGWFAVGTSLASALVLAAALGHLSAGEAWWSPLVAAPLAIGWVVQVLIGSWTHLLPSIGPGGPREHAVQREVLGRAATPRLVALNAGTALLALGWPLGLAVATGAGALLAAGAVVASVGLAASALRVRARPAG
jgi:nitrite reductase (NO-forming)